MSDFMSLLQEIANLVAVGTPSTLREAKALAAELLDTAEIADLAALHACTETLATHRHADAVAMLGVQWQARPQHRDLITFCVAESGEEHYDPARLPAPTYTDRVEHQFARMAAQQERGQLATLDSWQAELRKLDRIRPEIPEPADVHGDTAQTRYDFDHARPYRDDTPRDLRDAPTRDMQRATAAVAIITAPHLRRPADPRRVEPRVVTDYIASGHTWFPLDERIPRELDQADGYTIDYEAHAEPPLNGTPCVACLLERTARDRVAAQDPARHDDGLCTECRDRGRPGITPADVAHARDTIRRQMPAHANRRAADLIAPCAALAGHQPRGIVITWTRAYWRAHPEHRPFIAAWAAAQFGPARRPQTRQVTRAAFTRTRPELVTAGAA
ncbi:hypothetical protein [Amycolatopsis thermoflava]|uniref:hypothetical protein n=1 Tax=Amycolatopsis thermoflava TaxID=84480 RepID=UPI0004886D2C|nr:hypothetical protein [Amycolatopsis thermoflava]